MKWKKVIIPLIILTLIILTVAAGFFLKFGMNPGNPENQGSATGESALESLQDYCGESYVDVLADLGEVRKAELPIEYLVENSVYIMDEAAIEVTVQSYVTGAESTASATGKTTEAVVQEYGYSTVDEYRDAVRQQVEEFIRTHLAVYTAAKKEHVSISEKEYKEKLAEYGEKFGYEDLEEFTYYCSPASIANEMLYDKMYASLTE